MPKPAWILPVLAYIAFVSLGLPDTVLGVAWPDIRSAFAIPQSAIGAVLFTTTFGYFCSGVFAGALLQQFGIGKLLAVSSGLIILALLGYALAPTWPSFFPIGFVIGLGSGAIDASLNHYAARHFSARSLNWLHACWGLGASLGPYIMAMAIVRGHTYRGGYAWLALLFVPMTVAFQFTSRRWADSTNTATGTTAESPVAGFSARVALRNRRVQLHLLIFLLYTGVEASLGQWCFTSLREIHGLSIKAAGSWTAGYWASLTVGRVLLGFIVDRIGPDRLLRVASLGVLLGAMLSALTTGILCRLALLLLGFSLAPFFPTLIARTPARVGADNARYSVGFQVSAATLGAALVPASIGVLVSRFGPGAISIAWVCLGFAFLLVHERLIAMTREDSPV